MTGGAAFADLDETLKLDDGTLGTYETSGWRFGWTGGVGIEQALSDHVSVKADALFLDLGDAKDDEGGGYAFKFDDSMAVGRLGINFGF